MNFCLQIFTIRYDLWARNKENLDQNKIAICYQDRVERCLINYNTGGCITQIYVVI